MTTAREELERLEQAVKDALVFHSLGEVRAAVNRGILDVSGSDLRRKELDTGGPLYQEYDG